MAVDDAEQCSVTCITVLSIVIKDSEVPTPDVIEFELSEGSFEADDETFNHLEDLEAAGLLPDRLNCFCDCGAF